MIVPNVLLSGVVGSTAYGLAGPDSDIDRLGVFAAPTAAFHGLSFPEESIVSSKPDATYHEARKYCSLALGGNPTVSELMWLDGHEVATPLGEELVGIRTAFLSAKRTRDAYLGYATQQFRKLEERHALAARGTGKRTGTLAIDEDVPNLQDRKGPQRVRGEQPIQGRSGDGLQALPSRGPASRLLGQARGISPSEEREAEGRPGAEPGGTPSSPPQVGLWHYAGRGSRSAGEAGRALSNLRGTGQGGRSLPHDGTGEGPFVPEMQSRPGSLHGQSGDVGQGIGVPNGERDGVSDAERRHRRLAKHARHLMRLCAQGYELYATGTLRIRLEDPRRYLAFGERVAGGDIDHARSVMNGYEAAFDEKPSVLPSEPDRAVVEDWLLRVRATFFEQPQ